MTRSLALEWGYYGIRVSGIAPGWIGDTTGNTNYPDFLTASNLYLQMELR